MAIIDVIFGKIMTFGVMLVLYFTLDAGGGLTNIVTNLGRIDPKLISIGGPKGFWSIFSLVFLTSVAPFGMPQLVQKFYAIRDKKAVKTGMIASTIFALLIGGIAYFTGSTTRILLSPQTSPNAFTTEGKPIFDALMPELLTKVIPQSLSVVILLLILSASMSTLAALILISSSSVVKDIYAGFINRNCSDKKLTFLMRVLSGVFVMLSVILAFYKPSTIVSILGISWGAIGSVFIGPFIWGIFLPKLSKVPALISSIAGLSVCMFLYFSKVPSPSAGSIGMMVSLGVPPVLYFLLPKK